MDDMLNPQRRKFVAKPDVLLPKFVRHAHNCVEATKKSYRPTGDHMKGRFACGTLQLMLQFLTFLVILGICFRVRYLNKFVPKAIEV